MAREVAGKVIIVLLIYFVVLAFSFNVVSQFNEELGTSSDIITSSGGSYGLSFENGVCSNPRLSNYGYSYEDTNNPRCSVLEKVGTIYDQESCEAFRGTCSWDCSTNLFGSTTCECVGNLNLTYYNNGDDTFTENINFFGYTGNSYPLYEMALLNNGTNAQAYCEVFGFTWYTADELEQLFAPTSWGNTIGLIGDAFTFRLNIATDYPILNVFFSFLLVWLPLIMIVIAGYIMIR